MVVAKEDEIRGGNQRGGDREKEIEKKKKSVSSKKKGPSFLRCDLLFLKETKKASKTHTIKHEPRRYEAFLEN